MEENQNKDDKNAIEQMEKCQQERDEYLNNWKRERADFLNYKKDEAKRLEEFVKFANEAVILEMVDIVDDLERAAKEIKNEGLYRVLKKMQDLLNKYSLERISVEGNFDPLLHEAVTSEIPASEQSTTRSEAQNESRNLGAKIEEVRAGYTMYGRVIRPARVKIIK